MTMSFKEEQDLVERIKTAKMNAKELELLQRIKTAKEKRFTLTARILSGKAINVKVIDDANECPAMINMKNLDLFLNEAFPRCNDAVKALIYDRGKMFHEIDHAEFTTAMAHREKLAKKSKNQQMFLDLSNVLEDGRIERLGREKWEGTGDYLDALLSECMKESSPEMIGGLVLYVRKQMLRNNLEREYWKPYLKQIDKAVLAPKTKTALDIAFDIIEALPDTLKQDGNKQGEQGEQGESQNASEPENATQSNEADAGNAPDEEKGEEGESAAKDDGEDSGEAGNGSDSSTPNKGEMDKNVQEAIEEIVSEAIQNVKQDAIQEVEAILEEANEAPDGMQQYTDGEEEACADELSEVFTSLLVEQNRVKYNPSKEGSLNTLALTSALTSRKCFQTREETLGAPYVALLLDTSGSMRSRAEKLTIAARILHGSLQKAKVNVRVIEFGHKASLLKTIPLDDLPCNGNSTFTHLAMTLANDWLEEQGASRALMIVVTDGAAGNMSLAYDQKERCEQINGYVIGVRVGFPADAEAQCPEYQWHDYTNVKDVSTLPSVLQPKLEAFIAGGE